MMVTKLPDGTTMHGTNRDPRFIPSVTLTESSKKRGQRWIRDQHDKKVALRAAHHERNRRERTRNKQAKLEGKSLGPKKVGA